MNIDLFWDLLSYAVLIQKYIHEKLPYPDPLRKKVVMKLNLNIITNL
jgi:hypothetical protein